MIKYKITDGGDGHVSFLSELKLKELAEYYYHNSDDLEEYDFTNLETAISFVQRVDKVELFVLEPRQKEILEVFERTLNLLGEECETNDNFNDMVADLYAFNRSIDNISADIREMLEEE